MLGTGMNSRFYKSVFARAIGTLDSEIQAIIKLCLPFCQQLVSFFWHRTNERLADIGFFGK